VDIGGICFYPELKRQLIWVEGLRVLRETEKGILLEDPDLGRAWFPKSLIKRKGEEIGIPNWLLEEKGWSPEGIWELGDQTFKEFEREHLRGRLFIPEYGLIFDEEPEMEEDSNHFGDLYIYRAFNGGSKLVENVCREKWTCKVCGEERFLPYLLHFGDCYAEVCSDCVKKLNDQVVMEVREKTKRGWITSNWRVKWR